MAEIRFTVRARRDLIDIWLEVSETDPAVADDFTIDSKCVWK